MTTRVADSNDVIDPRELFNAHPREYIDAALQCVERNNFFMICIAQADVVLVKREYASYLRVLYSLTPSRDDINGEFVNQLTIGDTLSIDLSTTHPQWIMYAGNKREFKELLTRVACTESSITSDIDGFREGDD